MIYLIIALAAVSAGACGLGWALWRARRALSQSEVRCRSLQKERSKRENLQTMLDSRNAEARRLRQRLRQLEAEMADMEQQASELNLNLFHESGLRILREKEEGARQMKLDLMERQLDEANRKLKQERQEARENAARLNEVIDEQRETIDRLTAAQARRSPRRARETLPNQMTLDDLLK